MLESDQTERAARGQTLGRDHAEVERLQARLEVLYEDRLDQRIDAGTYDRNAQKIRQQQDVIRQRMQTAETTAPSSVSDATDFMMAISEAATSFPQKIPQKSAICCICSGKSRLERWRVADVVQNAVRPNFTFEPHNAQWSQ